MSGAFIARDVVAPSGGPIGRRPPGDNGMRETRLSTAGRWELLISRPGAV